MEELLAHRPLVTQKSRSNENSSPRQVALKTYNDIKGKNGDDDVTSKVKHASLRVLVHRSVVGDGAMRRISPSKSVNNGPSIDTPPTTVTPNTHTSTITQHPPTIATHNTPPTTTQMHHTLSPRPPSPPSRESAIGVYNRLKNEDELSSANVRIKQAALRTLVQRSVMDSLEKTTVHDTINKSSSSSGNNGQSAILVSQSNVIDSSDNNVSSQDDVDDDKGVDKPVTGMSSPQSSPRSNPHSSRPVTILPSSETAATKTANNTTVAATTTASTGVATSSSMLNTGTKLTQKNIKTGRNNLSTSLPSTSPIPTTRHLPLVHNVQKGGASRNKTRARQRALQAYRSQVATTCLYVCMVLEALSYQ